jgi:predicted enzyme related to lactoylglutathione lyase
MKNPVVHFEVTGKDGAALQKFYGELFEWNVNADNPMNYGMVTPEEGKGIGGGVGGTFGQGDGYVTFYMEVDDPQAALDKAEQLGGTTVMPVTDIPGAVTIAQFTDPEGHLIGLVKSAPAPG